MNAHFTSLTSFLAMGGYAFYVWLAYGIVLAGLLLLALNTFRQRKRILRHIKQQISEPTTTIKQPNIIYESQT